MCVSISKTQLVTKFAYEQRHKYPGTSIFWVSARTEVDIDAGFKAIAERLSLTRGPDGRVKYNDGSRGQSTNPKQAEQSVGGAGDFLFKEWMDSSGHEDWLLVLDNYDDIQVPIQKFLPLKALGGIIITTRDRKVIGPVANSGLALSAMDQRDAEKLFLRIQSHGTDDNWKDPSSHTEYDMLGHIMQELQCFPLAIDQAASFIRENSPMTFQEYFGYLKPRSSDRERLMRFKQANPRYPESIMTTWEISLEFLGRTHPRACLILQILGFLDHSYIPEELLVGSTKARSLLFGPTFQAQQLPQYLRDTLSYLHEGVEFRVAIGALTSLSLIQRNVSGPTIYVHPLVHEWIRVRLNQSPMLQAELAVASALILYQSFPVELVLWLPEGYPPWCVGAEHMMYHLRNILANFQDYHSQIVTMPFECFVLFETMFLAYDLKHTIQNVEVSYEMTNTLDRIIKSTVTRLPRTHVAIVTFVHKVALWLREGIPSTAQKMQTAHKIAKSLETLSLSFAFEATMASFPILVAFAILNTFELVNRIPYELEHIERPSNRLVHDSHRTSDESKHILEQEKNTRSCLLDALQRLFSFVQPMPPLTRWIDFMVKRRLLRILKPSEFAIYGESDVKNMLSTELLDYLTYDEKADSICLLARLLWEFDGERQYRSIKEVFRVAMLCCRAKLHQSQRAARETTRPHEGWSQQYISSTWGRGGQPREKIPVDIITPFGDLWTMTIKVARSISDPLTIWKMYVDHRPTHVSLTFPQRRWALDLFLGMSKLHKLILADKDVQASYKSSLVENLDNKEAQFALAGIYENLEEWTKLGNHLIDLLEYVDIRQFCESLTPRPWERVQATRLLRGPFDRTPPPAIDTGSSTTGKSAGRLVIGSMDLLALSSEIPTEVSVQSHRANSRDALDVIEVRLRDAALQRLLRHTKPEHQQEQKPTLLRLGIPLSCACIVYDRVDDAIASFIRLAERNSTPDPTRGPAFWLQLKHQLSVVRQIREEAPRFLGRLELIYTVAQLLPHKIERIEVAQARFVQRPSSFSHRVAGVGRDDVWWNDSEEEELEDDDHQMANSEKDVDDLDWEW